VALLCVLRIVQSEYTDTNETNTRYIVEILFIDVLG
jgi:hypothetical protein